MEIDKQFDNTVDAIGLMSLILPIKVKLEPI